MEFTLCSPYRPTGDQPQAIAALVDGLQRGLPAQVLMGVTGSGKTFTMANVLAQHRCPTLIISHNKTLAAQLYGEMKAFFPDNAVEYYVSYYDYYQPEAYLPTSDTYIEKDLAINEEIDRLRLRAVSALLSGRRDVVVVSSVSCIYGMGGPTALQSNIVPLSVGQHIARNDFLRQLVEALYTRNDLSLTRGMFRVRGSTLDVFPAYSDCVVRISWYDDEIESIEEVDATTFRTLCTFSSYQIFPATLFVTTRAQQQVALAQIAEDLSRQVAYFEGNALPLYAQRIKERVDYDMEMIRELGHCAGIENYSRYFDGRAPGDRPYCLLDFFPPDFLTIIDESHVTVPQIAGMYGGDRARKENLVQYGFRLPAAYDNRPLRYDEFQTLTPKVLYVSATPAAQEIEAAEGVVVEQVIRPTGLLDPEIEVRSAEHQVDDLLDEIVTRASRDERTLVTTLTKRMAEELAAYFLDHHIRAAYIHSDIGTLERVEIMTALRQGTYDVLVGVNLLREGLDLPEVSLVAILDADKEGFLRSFRSMTQTAGRAARNINGKVIMYADTLTDSMHKTIDETYRRREIQRAYNAEHHITPNQIQKSIRPTLLPTAASSPSAPVATSAPSFVGDPILQTMSREQVEKVIAATTAQMHAAAAQLDFLQAAQYRDEAQRLQTYLAARAEKRGNS